MSYIKEQKTAAREKLRGKMMIATLATLVYMVFIQFYSLLNMRGVWLENCWYLIFPIFAIVILFSIPMVYSYNVVFLNVSRNNSQNMVGGLFAYFKNGFGRAFSVSFLTTLFIALWSLLLIIPGIIKSLAYSMTFFVAHDHPEMSPRQCMKHSERLMEGHKSDLFVLFLSFIGWFLLSVITLGIAGLWVKPWITTTTAEFYHDLLAERKEVPDALTRFEN